MESYISKSALVAEIDRLQEATMDKNQNFLSSYHEGIFDGLSMLENFIDTIDTKEVEEEPVSNDFEEEFDNYANGILACDIQFEPFTHLHNCAKYFYELGLKAKGEEE